MALLRAVRDCGTLRAVSLVNLGLGDHFCRSLARVLPRLAALRLLDVTLTLTLTLTVTLTLTLILTLTMTLALTLALSLTLAPTPPDPDPYA